jgi:opine dehydrogenase
MRIAVLGTGPVGLGSMALLHSRGHVPVAWSPLGTLPAGPLHVLAEGALQYEATIDVAATCAEAVAGAAAVLVAVPATGYRLVLETLAAYLQSDQVVFISGHLSFGALFLSRLLSQRGIIAPIAAWGTTIVSGSRLAPNRVLLWSIRAEVDMATVPQRSGGPMLDLCSLFFGDRFRLREGLISITLSNVNPQNHLAIVLCNLTRMEKGEVWRQYANTTASVGRLMEAMDAERLAIADAFGVEVRPLRRHLHLSFHVPEGPVGEMVAELATGSNDPIAPATLDTRYVLEDAPFGLHAVGLLGRMCGRPALLHEAGLLMLSALYGRDLAAANDILPSLGLEMMNPTLLGKITDDGWHVESQLYSKL